MPRARFTVRMLMVAVAVAGVICSGIELRRRSRLYACAARKWEERDILSQDLMHAFAHPDRPEVAEICRREYDANARLAEFEGKLRRKYERAARYPWLRVEAHSREPE